MDDDYIVDEDGTEIHNEDPESDYERWQRQQNAKQRATREENKKRDPILIKSHPSRTYPVEGTQEFENMKNQTERLIRNTYKPLFRPHEVTVHEVSEDVRATDLSDEMIARINILQRQLTAIKQHLVKQGGIIGKFNGSITNAIYTERGEDILDTIRMNFRKIYNSVKAFDSSMDNAIEMGGLGDSSGWERGLQSYRDGIKNIYRQVQELITTEKMEQYIPQEHVLTFVHPKPVHPKLTGKDSDTGSDLDTVIPTPKTTKDEASFLYGLDDTDKDLDPVNTEQCPFDEPPIDLSPDIHEMEVANKLQIEEDEDLESESFFKGNDESSSFKNLGESLEEAMDEDD